MLTKIVELEIDLAVYLAIETVRNADPTGLGQGLESCRDVYAVAIDVVALDDHVAQIDANTQYDPGFLGQMIVGCGQGRLQFGGTAYGTDSAGKLDENAIAHDLHDPTFVGGHERCQDFGALFPEGRYRPVFICLHQTAVADDVGQNDGGEAALHIISP